MIYLETKSGNFLVKSLYSFLLLGRLEPFLRHLFETHEVSTKVGFFAWEATWDRILTIDQLKKG